METQQNLQPRISFEFFPPKTPDAADKLIVAAKQLQTLNPHFCSVTYGACATTQQGTYETVLKLKQNLQSEIVPHLTCVNASKEETRKILQRYQEQGIRRIVALRGDLPADTTQHCGDFHYANSLVEFIRAETGDHFTIEVAAYPEFHPEAASPQADLDNFKNKVEAGANNAITQYFLNPDAYFYFVDNCKKLGLTLPIIPGILPIADYAQLVRFSNYCGADIPRWLSKRLASLAHDPQAVFAFGCDVITELCQKLLAAGAPGLHFYTLNKAEPTMAIVKNLQTI